jgi:predicted dehydrogenase
LLPFLLSASAQSADSPLPSLLSWLSFRSTQMNKELRIGIIGAGGIVRSRHMPNLRQIDGVQVAAVSNRTHSSAEAFARDFNIPTIHDDWHQLLADPGIDIVWIGTWPYMHAELTVAALAAGKHVFCQARMAGDLAQARRMLDASRRHPDLVTMICPPPHGLAGDRLVRRLLQDNYCGQILQVRLTALNDAWLDPDTPMNWRKDERLSGRNILTLGIYIEVLHRWLGYHSSVMAAFDTHTPRRREPETNHLRDVIVPDAVRILARLESGAGAVYHLSGLCESSPDEIAEIYGTAGTIVYNFTKDTVQAARRGESCLTEIPLGTDRREWAVEQDFIQAVRTGDRSPIEPTFEQGLKYMEFLEAVWLSQEQHRAVALPLP